MKYLLLFLKIIINLLIATILTLAFIALAVITVSTLTGKISFSDLIDVVKPYIEKWMP